MARPTADARHRPFLKAVSLFQDGPLLVGRSSTVSRAVLPRAAEGIGAFVEKEGFSVTKSVEERALQVWGVDAQLRQTQEELAELIAAISRFMRERTDSVPVVEEIADVEIMLAQLKLIFGGVEVSAVRSKKFERLRRRVEEAEAIPREVENDSLRWARRMMMLERRIRAAEEDLGGRR